MPKRIYLWAILVGAIGCVLLGVAVSVALSGFSTTVPIEKVYGTYVASYPFGTDTIMLDRDGTFVQKVVVYDDPPPAVTKGHWEFDAKKSHVNFDRYLPIDDGFGRLNKNWRTPNEGVAAVLPVERLFFRTVMSSGAEYPYFKQ